jgi:uncharacterized metal-binding protein
MQVEIHRQFGRLRFLTYPYTDTYTHNALDHVNMYRDF